MIVAVDHNNVIGSDGGLPWHLPDDLRWFRRMTVGKAVIMGRRTFESIGKPLGKRLNIVLTRRPEWSGKGVVVAHSLEAALNAAADFDEVVVIGGEAVYRSFLPQVQRLYITQVDAQVEGDTYFPQIEPSNWIEVARQKHAADERHPYAFDQITLDRVTAPADTHCD